MKRSEVVNILGDYNFFTSEPVDLAQAELVVNGDRDGVETATLHFPDYQPVQLGLDAYFRLGTIVHAGKIIEEVSMSSMRDPINAALPRIKRDAVRRMLHVVGSPRAYDIIKERVPVFNPVDAMDVLEQHMSNVDSWDVQRAIPGSVRFTAYGHNPMSLARGDVHSGGISIEYSPISSGASITVSTAIRRLVCSNGMLSSSFSRVAKSSVELEDPLEWVSERIAELLPTVEQEYETIMAAEGQVIEDIPVFLLNMFNSLKLPGATRDMVTQQLMMDSTGNGFTYYDVVNAMSYVATHDPDTREKGRTAKLQTLSLDVANSVDQYQCWRTGIPDPEIAAYFN